MRQKKIIATKKASRQPEDKNVIITPLGEQGVIIQSPGTRTTDSNEIISCSSMNELLLLLHKKVIYSLFNSQFNSILFYRLDQGAIPGIPLHTVHVLPAKQDSPDHHFSSDQLSLHLDNLRKDPQGIALITSENLLGCIVSIQKKPI